MGWHGTDFAATVPDSLPLRTQRGNPAAGDTDARAAGLPRRCAPRNGREKAAPRDDEAKGAPRDDGEKDAPRNDGGEDAPGADGEADPLRFAAEVLGVELWRKQEEVLEAVRRERRVAVKSGNGLGKDFTAAVAVLWYLQKHDPAIVLSTAPTFRQVRHVLWRQIHSLHRRASDALGGKMLDTRWELSEDRYALGLSANDADQFQGFHSPNMFVVVDEAEGVGETIYEAVESVMTSANPRLLLIGNPTTTSGGFHRAFHRERGIYRTITISALESPNVAEGRIVIPGLTTAAWVDERRAIWGEDSPLFRARVLGEFPERGDDNLIAVPDIDAAVYEGVGEGVGPVVIGVDVARFGPDRSVIVARRGNVVEDIRAYHHLDTHALADLVSDAVRDRRPERVNVDDVGVGAGVVDNLARRGIAVQGVNGSREPRRERACANLRAEGFWTLARRFETRNIRIPHDVELMAELASLRYRFDSRGRVLMESKESMRGRGLPSPDKADALMLAFLDDDPFAGDRAWMRELFV